MIGILGTKFKRLVRNPGMFLGMTVMTVIFGIVVGLGDQGTKRIPVYAADEGVRDSMVGESLDETSAYSYQWMDKEAVIKKIQDGKAEMGVALGNDDFDVLVGVQSGFVDMVKRTVQQAYMKQDQYTDIASAAEDKGQNVEPSEIDEAVEDGAFQLDVQNFEREGSEPYNQTYHALFGFTLFFVIYTIGSSVFQILAEKDMGVWDRLILSPVKKWQIYTANFLYSFLIGCFQIGLVFAIFNYLAGVDFGSQFMEVLLVIPVYVFAIVSLCILLTGLVKTGQQFNAVVSIVALAMAMLGGLFWPLEIVESDIMLALSKVVPTSYGLDIMNQVVVYGQSISDVLFPIGMLLLMGVLMAGIGIHLMERRHIKD